MDTHYGIVARTWLQSGGGVERLAPAAVEYQRHDLVIDGGPLKGGSEFPCRRQAAISVAIATAAEGPSW